MNIASWIDRMSFDPQLCGEICLTLAHSIWQMGLLAILATLLCRLIRRDNPERPYAICVGAIALGIAMLPITLGIVDVPGPQASMLEQNDLAVIPAAATPTPPISAADVELSSARVEVPVESPAERAITQANPVARLTSAAPWFVAAYFSGVMFMSLRLVRGIWESHKLARRAEAISRGPLPQLLRHLADAWSMRALPALAHASHVVVPQVVGVLRPTILLPTAALTGLMPDELEMILAHELAHIRRHDLWVNLLQRLAETLLFFNPALWYLSRRISTYREYCCDELTCQLPRHERNDLRLCYANALLRVVALSGKVSRHGELAALAATGSRPSELRRRVARLFGEPLREPMGLSRNTILALIAGSALVVAGPVAWQNAAEVESQSKVSEEAPSKRPKVEVVAIGTHDEEPQRWWDAEGKLLEKVPFTWTAEAGRVSTPDKLWRRVVIRINSPISNSPRDRTWQIVGARGSAGGIVSFNEEFEPGTYLSRYFSLRDGTDTFGLRVGLATGEWKVMVQSSGMSAYGIKGKSIVFSEPITTDEGINVVVSHDAGDKAYRVVAVDKKGTVHESVRSGGSSAGQISQSRATFPRLALENLDHFEFQTREYEWTEIKDLPVEPGGEISEVLRKWRQWWNSPVTKKAETKPRRETIDYPLSDEDDWRRFWNPFVKDPNSGIVTVDEKLPDWLQQFEQDSEITHYRIRSKDQFLQTFGSHFDEMADFPGLFEGVVEGLERDPFGPQVDMLTFIKYHLGDELIIVKIPGKSATAKGHRYLVCWSTNNTPEVERTLTRFMRVEPNAEPITIAGTPVWKLTGKDEPASVYCVYDNHLILATDLVMLQQVLTRAKSGSDETGAQATEAKVGENISVERARNTLEVRPLLENLEPAPSAYLTLWRELTPDETTKPADQTWTNMKTGTVWVRERSAHPNDGRHGKGMTQFQFTDLRAGRYCVTAATYQLDAAVPDPTPFGTSKAVLLGIRHRTETISLDVPMTGNRSLTVRVLDQQKGEPIEGMAVRLFNSQGVPIVHGHGSGNFFERTSDAGTVHFRNLPSDEYRIDILGRRAEANQFVEYEPFEDSLRIQLKGPGPQTLTYNAPPHRLSDEQIAKQFPFSVYGRVSDEDGQPIANVEVRAATGLGTLLGGGSVRTDHEGNYTLYFGPGVGMQRGENLPLGVGVQAALISARKTGWYETSLNTVGDYLMSDAKPEDLQAQIAKDGEVWGRKSTDRIVFPNQPREVNFTLAPAATIKGRLVSDDNRDKHIYLKGEDLPPGHSVLDGVTTGDDGEFEFESVPINRPWRFGMRVGGTWQEVETAPFFIDKAGNHRCEVSLEAAEAGGDTVSLKLSYHPTD